MEEAWDETADFVIIGSGGGAMVASLYLKSIGKRPLVLEKTDKLGGSTAMSGGVLWIPAHPLQQREGVEDSIEAGRRYLDATVGKAGPGSTPERKDAFVRNGPPMISWLEQQGMKFVRADRWADYYDDREGGLTRGRSLGAPLLDTRKMGPLFDKLRLGPLVVPMKVERIRDVALVTGSMAGMIEGVKIAWRMLLGKVRGRPIISNGGSLQGRMLILAADAGAEFRIECGVTELVEKDGKVLGVVALGPAGKTQRIRALDGVLINAGGFARNIEMRERFGPKPATTEWTNANPGDTGDMHREVARIGGTFDQMEEAWWVPSSLPPGGGAPTMHAYDLSKPHTILVNRQGRRLVNESASYMEVGMAIYANDATSYAILDSRHRRKYPFGVQAPGKVPKAWLDSGYMVKADTLRELAEKCGIDPDGLEAEVAHFNAMAVAGKDADFHRGERGYDNWFGDPRHKPNPNLGTIEKGPFYATQVYPGDVGTSGGIVTDEHARVLKADGSAIAGLYATGNSTASVMGHIYPGAGASIAASYVFAWIAAHNASRTNLPVSA